MPRNPAVVGSPSSVSPLTVIVCRSPEPGITVVASVNGVVGTS
ncbi:MAG TPA: hypothetical protein VIQ79_28585 [Kribbella sp.]